MRTDRTTALCPDCKRPIGIASFAGETMHLDPGPAWREGSPQDARRGLCFFVHHCSPAVDPGDKRIITLDVQDGSGNWKEVERRELPRRKPS
jgi:hypothetical protein